MSKGRPPPATSTAVPRLARRTSEELPNNNAQARSHRHGPLGACRRAARPRAEGSRRSHHGCALGFPIQSNYRGVGSGLVPSSADERTLGFTFQDRGQQFALDPKHPNVYAPGKRPFHTIIPAFMTKNGHPLLSFGVMGGDMQPQGHVQVVVNLVDFGVSVQAAGDAARFHHDGSTEPLGLAHMKDGGTVHIETGVPQAVADELARRGHKVVYEPGTPNFGGYQAILRDPYTGVYWGASEFRKDGLAAGYDSECSAEGSLVRSRRPVFWIQGEQTVSVIGGQREEMREVRLKGIWPARGWAPAHQQGRVLVVLEPQNVTELVCDDVAEDVRQRERGQGLILDGDDASMSEMRAERKELRLRQYDDHVAWKPRDASRQRNPPCAVDDLIAEGLDVGVRHRSVHEGELAKAEGSFELGQRTIPIVDSFT